MTRHAWFRFGLHALICALVVSVSADGVLNAWSNLGQDRGLGQHGFTAVQLAYATLGLAMVWARVFRPARFVLLAGLWSVALGLGAALALAVWGAQPVLPALAAGVGVSLLAAAVAWLLRS